MVKVKIAAILLAGAFCIGMAACGETGTVQSVTTAEAEPEGLDIVLEEEEEEEPEPLETPEAVRKLSDEDAALVTGELSNGVYTNRYFGYKLTVPDDWTMICEANGSEDSLVPITGVYDLGCEGVVVSAINDGEGFYSLYVTVNALDDDEVGLSEQELVEKNIQETIELNKAMEVENNPQLEMISLAGEEHPAAYSTDSGALGNSVSAAFYIPKGDFEYSIHFVGWDIELEELTSFLEKI